jgi:hypothetical protein
VKSIWQFLTIFLLLATTGNTDGQSGLFHKAENQVQVAIVQVKQASNYTEVRLETLSATRGDVCWYKTGPDSPYLIADGRRYRYLHGDNVRDCPNGRKYDDREIMVLRFEPLPQTIREFSLVEGEGGEEQMRGNKRANETFWNFLYVKLN